MNSNNEFRDKQVLRRAIIRSYFSNYLRGVGSSESLWRSATTYIQERALSLTSESAAFMAIDPYFQFYAYSAKPIWRGGVFTRPEWHPNGSRWSKMTCLSLRGLSARDALSEMLLIDTQTEGWGDGFYWDRAIISRDESISILLDRLLGFCPGIELSKKEWWKFPVMSELVMHRA